MRVTRIILTGQPLAAEMCLANKGMNIEQAQLLQLTGGRNAAIEMIICP